MIILANDGISKSGEEKLSAHGFTVVTDNVPQDNLEAYINDNQVVGLLVRSATKVRQPLIDACPSLKLVGRGGVGMDNIDVDYARSKGLQVFNTPAASSQSVAELVLGHMINTARGLHDSNKNMHTKGSTEFKVLKKRYAKGFELRGKTLGIVGMGRIGKSLASYALGIGMRVITTDRKPDPVKVDLFVEGIDNLQVEVPKCSLDELLSKSDFVSLHIPKQPNGDAVIGEKELQLMKPNAVLINAARGGVIDEDALIAACKAGKIRAAGLDVFENEPTPDTNVLACDHFSLSPHIGAATVEAQDRIGVELADQIIAILK